MRVVVTGATSMIGVALIQSCIQHNCEVLAIVREGTTRIGRLPKSDLVEVQYADLHQLNKVQMQGDYDVFYHFAWGYTDKAGRNNPFMQEKNIQYTLDAVELARKLGCHTFIGAGSQAEYGPYNGVLQEEVSENPVMAYGVAKLAANRLSKILCEQYGMKHIWARILSVYGTMDNEGTMIDYAISQFTKGEMAIFSEATQMWNYLYEEDAGELFYLLGAKEIESGIYFVANNESKVLREYIEIIRAMYGDSAVCEFRKSSTGQVAGLQVDMTRTIMATGFTPKYSFEEGIQRVIEYRREQ